MMVTLVAIVVIIAIGFIVLKVIPANDTTGTDINVEVPDVTPNGNQ